ncbi:DNA cytosine methyltransferase [Kocuria sp. ZOR0020]|uniref:DNA cytosine methyltransferase n=1 Tax=Kocuria sp. ZOR0020 TaxID=1339234 RepID=UPI0009DFA21B|nr:DNA cytosine methyltransferase [Kocuria sp. ZOR0020]
MTGVVRVIDLFTGAGGLTQGWHQAAEEMGLPTSTVAAVEFDRAAAASYRANFHTEQQYVGPVESWLVEHPTPSADVIIGGPPCQGFSALGRQDINDERNFLWLKYAETIVAARPRYFVLENVVPFLTSPQFAALEQATEPGRMLENYQLETFTLSAADYGAHQNRRRAVVIGRRRGLPQVGVPVASHDGQWQTVRDAFAGIPDEVSGVELPIVRAPSGSVGIPGPFRSHQLHLGRNYTELSLRRFSTIPAGGNRFDIPDELLSPCWRKHKTGTGDVMGRLKWDAPSVTIRTEFFKPEKGRYLHPRADRAITHFEAARLQGFPDDFTWYGSKVAIARQIGNAVPVQLGRAVARSVLGALTASGALRHDAAGDHGGELESAA